MGGQERQQDASSRWSTTGRRASRRKPLSRPASSRSAARSSSRSACRSPIPISRRSCSASPTSSRTPPSSISRARRRRFSPSSSPSAASANPASGSSARATSRPTKSQRHGRPDARHHHRRRLFGRAQFAHSTSPTSRPIEKANGFRPDFVSLGGYDGMHLIYEALKKTGGNADGDALIAAMKGMAWESPRGPMSIDPETRDIVSQYLHPQGRKDQRAALEYRVGDVPGGEGPDEGRGEISRREFTPRYCRSAGFCRSAPRPRRRIGPSFCVLTGASVSAWRASR